MFWRPKELLNMKSWNMVSIEVETDDFENVLTHEPFNIIPIIATKETGTDFSSQSGLK